MTEPVAAILDGLDDLLCPAITGPSNGAADIEIVPKSSTDLVLARRLVRDHGQDLRHAPQLGHWLHYDGQRWTQDLTGEVFRRAKAVVDAMLDAVKTAPLNQRSAMVRDWNRAQGAARLRAIVELATTEPGVPVLVDQLDANPWALTVTNGIVDLRTGDLRPHDREDLATRLVPVVYDAHAQAPTWLQFLSEVFDADEDLIAFVKRFAGYSLTGDVSEHVLAFLHGSGGNGKTTFLNALRFVMGDYGLQLDPRLLALGAHEEHPTGLTDLRGARLVVTVETEAGRHLAEALVKSLTGGDPIRARRMRCDYFEFLPSHKLWMAGNYLPRIRGTDHGIWRRIALVPFDVVFAEPDKALPDKLRAEAAGILAWMVAGCLDWQASGLLIPSRVESATNKYRNQEDHVGRFLADCCQLGDSLFVSASELRARYEQWCAGEGEHPWSAKAVGAELTSRGFDSDKRGHGNTRMWIDLGLVPKPEVSQ